MGEKSLANAKIVRRTGLSRGVSAQLVALA